MQSHRRTLIRSLASAAALPVGPIAGRGQAYPTRPVTLIVPYAAGGSADVLPRIIAERMRLTLGKSVIIENVPGAAGSIGAGRLARAAPDGYTIGLGTWSTHVANGAVYTLSYDVRHDFEPIAQIAASPLLIATSTRIPANTLVDLLAWSKARPESILQGTNGSGSVMHLAGILLQQRTGTRITFVPYRGSAPAVQDLLGGHLDLYVGLPADLVPQLRTGNVKVHAIAAPLRIATAPDVPTTDEAGLPGFYVSAWFGLWAPRGAPNAALAALSAAVREALADADVRRRLETDLHLVIPHQHRQTPDGLRDLQTAEIERWWPIIRAAQIVPE